MVLLPAVPEALRCYCTELAAAFDRFIEENEQDESGDPAEAAPQPES